MNKLMIIGNLTANPESRLVDTSNGPQTVCNFSVAVNMRTGGKDKTEYFRVSCWNRFAENVMKYLVKGSKVYVEGPASARAYTAHDGTAKASLEIAANTIEFLSSSRQNNGTDPAQGYPPMPPAPNADEGFMNIPPGTDEGIPFA